MTQTPTGPRRIRGLLPESAVVFHKTGTSGTNSKGITAATNDVGMVTLPGGKKYAIVVFVADSAGDVALREGVIARISKLSWDYFSGRQ
jgi:beta-lactamase class A